MANNLGIDFAADLEEQIEDLSSTLVWGSQTIDVLSTGLDKDHDFDSTGFDVVIRADIGCPLASFTSSTPPPITTEVTLDGVECRIESSTTARDGVNWRGTVTHR